MKAVLLYNPVAGRVPLRYFVHRAVNEFTRLGWTVELAASRSGTHTTELARQAAADGYDALFTAGGDGTIGQAVAGLVGSQTALGILPAGTANVLAIELGLPVFGWHNWWALEQNVRTLIASPIFSVDVGLCNNGPFLLWAGIGLDAIIVARIEPHLRAEKYFAVPRYALQTLWSAMSWHGMDLQLWADDEKIEGHFLMGVINNIRTYMGGLATLSPDSHLDDDRMDLWLFSGNGLGDALRHALGLLAGWHVTAPDVRRIAFTRLRVESQRPFSVQVDGEPRASVHRAEFSILPRSLRLMIPLQSLSLLKQSSILNATSTVKA